MSEISLINRMKINTWWLMYNRPSYAIVHPK